MPAESLGGVTGPQAFAGGEGGGGVEPEVSFRSLGRQGSPEVEIRKKDQDLSWGRRGGRRAGSGETFERGKLAVPMTVLCKKKAENCHLLLRAPLVGLLVPR